MYYELLVMAYTVIVYSDYISCMTCFNSKATPTTDYDYSCHIKAVARLSLFTGLEYMDWTTGLSYFPFLDKFLCLFTERSLI